MTASARPKVSIILPVYNAAGMLRQALDSALGQSLTETEVIAVDDGSDDDSYRILAERAASDQRLRIFRQPVNSGTFAARNRGLRECRGEYIMCLDPDDFLDRNAAEELTSLADREKADVVHFGTKEFIRRPDGSIKPQYNWTAPDERRISGGNAVLRDLLLGGHNWSLCFKLIRREICLKALAETEDFFCVMGEDLCFYLAAAFSASSLVQTGKAYYNYDTGAGITSVKTVPPEKFRRTATLLDALGHGEHFLNRKGVLADPELAAGWEKIVREQYLILWNRWYSRLAPGTRGEVGEYLLQHAPDKELFLLSLFEENDYLRENEEFFKFSRGIYLILNYIFPMGSYARMKLKTWFKRRKLLRKGKK